MEKINNCEILRRKINKHIFQPFCNNKKKAKKLMKSSLIYLIFYKMTKSKTRILTWEAGIYTSLKDHNELLISGANALIAAML